MESIAKFTEPLKKAWYFDRVIELIDQSANKERELEKLQQKLGHSGQLALYYIDQAAEFYLTLKNYPVDAISIEEFSIRVDRWGAYTYEPLNRKTFLLALYFVLFANYHHIDRFWYALRSKIVNYLSDYLYPVPDLVYLVDDRFFDDPDNNSYPMDNQRGLFERKCEVAMCYNFREAYNYYVMEHAKTYGTRANTLNADFDHSFWCDTAKQLLEELRDEKYSNIDISDLLDNMDYIKASKLVRLLVRYAPGEDGWNYWQKIARWKIAERISSVGFILNDYTKIWVPNDNIAFNQKEVENLAMSEKLAITTEEMQNLSWSIKSLIMKTSGSDLRVTHIHTIINEDEINQEPDGQIDSRNEVMMPEEQCIDNGMQTSFFSQVSLCDEFPSEIRKNRIASEMMVCIISKVIRPLVEQKKAWTWGHVMTGMNQSGVIHMNAAAFARAINSILPDKKTNLIERSITGYRKKIKNGYIDKDKNIIDQVKTIFEMIREIIE